jgi:hypothetical protein
MFASPAKCRGKAVTNGVLRFGGCFGGGRRSARLKQRSTTASAAHTRSCVLNLAVLTNDLKPMSNTTANGGSLGSRFDEERS